MIGVFAELFKEVGSKVELIWEGPRISTLCSAASAINLSICWIG